ncbi:Uncharacterized protein OBRU01_11448 [Operophtera brumata]|uniref:E3 ubiquitin-protein ligase APD1-4 middle domain-containing protein n=1 Tax=Operophtera brumata TaxID=104452 RepID=A0A0L7LBW3_OPEBR|nr:Uncharacterized protein OBRU01_11448 [Operophtera brumata]
MGVEYTELRLQALGDKGKRVLVKLHETMGVEYTEQKRRDTMQEARAKRELMLVNETTPFDMSNSEFWSSFSSSEEALLECAGLILNLPLTPHSGCRADASEDERCQPTATISSYSTLKTKSRGTSFERGLTCRRPSTRSPGLSSGSVVLELPLRNNDSLWNEQFVIISECEPRTSIYLFCVLSVPVLIMVFAFQ